MKGLILSGGRGTRLRPLTYTRAKQLIPIANKPNLFYIIEDLVAAGIHDIAVVVGDTATDVQAALGSGERWGVSFSYIQQAQPLGLAHAVSVARDYLADDPFVMYLGDNLLSGGIRHLLEAYERHPHSHILVTPVANPEAFGVVLLDDQDRIVRLVEKPQHFLSDLALVGVYLLTPDIHEVIAGLEPSNRGEYEITEAIQGLLERGFAVKAHRTRGWWKDTGRPEDLLDANRLVLSTLLAEQRGSIENCELIGEVDVAKGAVLRNSSLRGPVSIAADAHIEDSYIGPYSAIGRAAVVLRSEVEYSILLDGSQVQDLPYRLDRSILGQDTRVRPAKRRHSLRLILGDRSVVEL